MNVLSMTHGKGNAVNVLSLRLPISPSPMLLFPKVLLDQFDQILGKSMEFFLILTFDHNPEKRFGS